MKRIFAPTRSSDDWKNLLAEPEKQWRTGYSARTLACSWENAQGFPPEVLQLFTRSGILGFEQVDLLFAFPEHQVALPPPGRRPSQNDLFVLAKAKDGSLIAITVEGKVSEPFDKTLGDWKKGMSNGKAERLKFI